MKGRPAVFALAIGGWIAAALSTVQTSAPQGGGAGPKIGPYDPSEIKAVLDKYCVTCHSERLHTAGLVLEGIDVANPAAHADGGNAAARCGCLRCDGVVARGLDRSRMGGQPEPRKNCCGPSPQSRGIQQ